MKKKKNFLDVVPEHSSRLSWDTLENGNIQLIVPRDGGMEKIVRKFFKTPDKMTLDLDSQGSFVWKCIDGENTVHDISKKLHTEFGEESNPVIERLVTYLQILKNNNFIVYRKETLK